MMKIRVAIVSGLSSLLLSVPSAAQTTAVPSSKLALDIVAPDAATAQAYTWRVYDDGAPTGRIMPGAV